ncbi:probable LRR receptor-like serine/threonine-protein kinase RPK1 [Carica papaya]|uniref:probable LRR receptor-like serine/threonine-protein kinase RPK1 n=1 Tax=Carica papaya TaxID=3649 RepID=UPI000B8CE689|nr:probable LRR receptor-like serine/threonine-protein kinase RPK1 [Carica papaya]
MLPFFFDSKWAFPFALSSHCHYPFRPLFSHLSSFRAQANFFQLHIKYCRIVMAVFWFLFFSFTFAFSHADTTAISADLLSLLSFKSSISRDPSTLLSNWNLTVNHCTWNGVTCHHLSGRVTALNFSFSVSSSRALYGTLKESIGNLTELRALSLANNGFSGEIPANIGQLQFLEVLELQGSNFSGHIPYQISYLQSLRLLNLSRNSLSGSIPDKLIGNGGLRVIDLSYNLLSGEIRIDVNSKCEFLHHLKLSYNFLVGNIPPEIGKCENLGDIDDPVISHDFSWNRFIGSIPLFSVGDGILVNSHALSYRLLLNNNMLNGSLQADLLSKCDDMVSFSVNLSANQISGEIHEVLPLGCMKLIELEAAENQIHGLVPPDIDKLKMLQRLNLRGNRLSGALPGQFGLLKNLKWVFLGGNSLTGEIPSQIGQLDSLIVLDLSHNALTGYIPANLTNAKNLKVVLLDHNKLYGEVPSSFSSLSDLSILDVSYNNLSGHIPQLQHQDDCGFFKGNRYLDPCPEQSSASSTLPVPLDIQKQRRQRKLKYLVVAVATSSVIVLCILLLVVVIIFLRKRKFGRLASLRGKTLVTFADAPVELDYDSVVRATGNFSIRNLIGTGGFGSTYKAELIPGYLVAVKRLSIGRFQGLQQFDAEIRTLGRIRHKNLVTLIGCYVGEAEMFLIYNYLSGGNLETFIHEKSGKNSEWSVSHKIAMDIAQALAYLHYTCVPRIVHRDIKPSNILLDEKLNAYLSDFGLARLLEVSETHATTDVAGTFGYVAPEYATTCRVSDKADVYSFGVVLLELISGKKSLDPSFSEYGNGFNIVAWARLLIKEGRSSEVFSPELWEAGPEENLLGMLRLASVCTVEMLPIRPSMDQVLETLKQLKL